MEEIVKNLNEFLCDLEVMNVKLQNYHWNVNGKGFFITHEKLEEYYDEIRVQIDEIAEHILSLGYQPLGTMQDFMKNSEIQEAKNEKIKNTLQHKWQDIVSKREYIAICEGVFKEKSGTVKSYLKENVNHLMYSSLDKSGQFAVTHYKVLKDNGKYSMVDVNIDSGRKNQIRVHMGDLKHKVVGDEKYGPVSSPIGRLGLHAYVLEFKHPTTGKIMNFKAKIPEIFNSLFNKR